MPLAYLETPPVVDPGDVAGIFIEPIQGEGGYLPAPPEFLQELQRICRQHDILLIADEVQSGMGRTGKWWASEHAEIEPDLLCTAKGIASGLPLSALIARADVMNWPPGAHASTFGGNPVSIAAALANDRSARAGLYCQCQTDRRLAARPHGGLAPSAQDRG